MRFLLMFFMLMATPAFGATFSVEGPAAADVTTYLQKTQSPCPNPDKPGCTLASKTISAQTFYGQFPKDVNYYSVTFLFTDSGGSGPNLSVLVMKSTDNVQFSFFEILDNIYGYDPHGVRFGEHRLLTWSGLIEGPDDAHCCPTQIQSFSLFIKR